MRNLDNTIWKIIILFSNWQFAIFEKFQIWNLHMVKMQNCENWNFMLFFLKLGLYHIRMYTQAWLVSQEVKYWGKIVKSDVLLFLESNFSIFTNKAINFSFLWWFLSGITFWALGCLSKIAHLHWLNWAQKYGILFTRTLWNLQFTLST